MTAQTRPRPPAVTAGNACRGLLAWARANPAAALLGAAAIGLLVYFYGFANLFYLGTRSTFRWATMAWNPENNQEHGWLILPASLALAWHHRERIRSAPRRPSWAGLAVVLLGIMVFLIGARSVQPRLALISLPAVLLGITWTLWGRQVARIVLFPCALMLFMVPSGFIEQASFGLQFAVTGAVGFLARLIGVSIQAVGTTVTSRDGTFSFEIAEGCSGIRSLMAMMMLAALYVHLTQRELWKKIVIFAAAIPFAVIGNIGRIFTVILFAKFVNEEIAAGIYHDYSGFVFFPFAIMAMLGLAKLLNLGSKKMGRPRDGNAAGDGRAAAAAEAGAVVGAGPTVGRLLALDLVLALGFGTVLLLPAGLKFQPLGINLELPRFVGNLYDWEGHEQEVSLREIQALGDGTEFSRKIYTNGTDQISVSVVLSGQDMNVSIHRPERCLPAQGLTIVRSARHLLAIPAGGGKLPVTRLLNMQPAETGPPEQSGGGANSARRFNISYYWFTGYDTVSGSHMERMWFDVRDRFLGGYNQRWAYVTVSASITKPPNPAGKDEAATDAMLRQFIGELVPAIHHGTVKYR